MLRQLWSYPRFGVLIEIGDTDWQLYHRAGPMCWLETDAALKAELKLILAEHSLMSDGSAVRFRSNRGAAEFEMKPLEMLPANCSDSKSRVDVYEAFSELLRKHYPFFSRRGITYVAQSAAVRRSFSQLGDDAILLKAMQDSLYGLADPKLAIQHSMGRWTDPEAQSVIDERLQTAFASQDVIATTTEYTQRWQDAISGALRERYLVPDSIGASDGLLWGVDSNGVGYLRLDQNASAQADELSDVLDRAFRVFEQSTAVIVDLSSATAINDAAGLELLSFLIGGRVAAIKARFHEVPTADWFSIETPGRQKALAIPLFVVISEYTADDAERLVLALQGRENITVVGGQTLGSTADVITKSLPNGWRVDIPAIEYADLSEVSYEGVGIPPDFVLELFRPGQLTRGHPVALQTLSDLIAEGHFENF